MVDIEKYCSGLHEAADYPNTVGELIFPIGAVRLSVTPIGVEVRIL